MTAKEKEMLDNLETKLRHLIYLHDQLKEENRDLKALLNKEKDEKADIEKELIALRDNYTNLKTAATISISDSDVKQTKQRLSKLVREVDKCITLLNE